MDEIEKQLDKSVEELKKTLQMLKDKLALMETKNAPRPDVRRVAYQITLLETMMYNYFSVGVHNIGEGDYQLKTAVKIADKY